MAADEFDDLIGDERPKPVMVEMKAADIPFATTGLEAPTIFADLIRGAMVVAEVAKISLVEHRQDAISDEMRAVHVANLVVPRSQLRPWGEFFTRLANQLEEQPQNGE